MLPIPNFNNIMSHTSNQSTAFMFVAICIFLYFLNITLFNTNIILQIGHIIYNIIDTITHSIIDKKRLVIVL